MNSLRGRLAGRASARIGVAALLLLMSAVPAASQTEYELGERGFEVVEEPRAGTPEGELAAVRAALADGEPDRARQLATRWIKDHPRHDRLAEAYLLRGDAKTMDRNYYKALFDYEIVARRFPDSDAFFTAMERELDIAQRFASGKNRKWLGMRIIPASGEAEELLIRIQERAPGSKLAQRAGKALGDHYYRRGEMLLASETYGIFTENYPDSQWTEYAARRRITANLGRFKGPRFDATGLLAAERQLLGYQENYPAAAEEHAAEELLVRIDESLAEKMFTAASYYENQGEDVSAVYMYGRVVTDHPDSAAAARALKAMDRLDPDRAAELREGEFEGRPVGQPSPQTTGTAEPIGGRPETEGEAGADPTPTTPEGAPFEPTPEITPPE